MPRRKHKRRYVLLLAAAAAVLLAVLLLNHDRPVPRTAGAVRQFAYVWQRSWTDSVCRSVAAHSHRFDGLCLLAVEVSFTPDGPRVIRVPLPYERLRPAATAPDAAPSIGLALRIGPFAGPFAADDEPARLLCRLARSIVAEATDAGLTVAELQIDFDAAERVLAGYRQWVEAIRRAVHPTPVTITALPAWLDADGFAALVAAADGYVLQVHSLSRPAGPDAPAALCDPAAARRWVERAARITGSKPFRVALPTYSYLVAFDAAGRFVGLSAEGPQPAWSSAVRLRLLRADPAGLADLVRGWTADRPAAMTGILWYRLPVGQDRMNWRWPTLAAVMAARTPQPNLVARARPAGNGLFDVTLENAGDDDAPLDVAVSADWPEGATCLAADALGGFAHDRPGANRVDFTGPGGATRGPPALLAPGGTVNVGWIRLDRDTEVVAHVRTMDR